MPNVGMTTTNADDLLQTAIVEANLSLGNGFSLKNFVTVRPTVGGLTVRFPRYADIVSTELTEGVPISTYEDLITSSVDVTVKEHGATVPVTDMIAGSYNQSYSDAGKKLGQAILAEMNQKIWASFADFDYAYGDSSATLNAVSEAAIEECISVLESNNAPDPYVIIVTPKVYSAIRSFWLSGLNLTAEGYRQAVMSSGLVPKVLGCDVYSVRDLSSTVKSAETATCGVFSRDAIGFAETQGIKVEPERSGRLRGTYLTGTAVYGVKVINPVYGVKLIVTQ